MSELADRDCVPCHGGVPKLPRDEALRFLAQLDGWSIVSDHHLQKRYSFRDFAGALAFVERVAAVAEAENHHPDIRFGWGYVTLEIHTHAIDGLTESDFVLAAKCDRAPM